MADIIDEPPLDTGSIMHFQQQQFQTAYFVIGGEFHECCILTPRVRWVINTCWAVGVGTVRVNAQIWLGFNAVYRRPAGRKLLKLLYNLPLAFNDHYDIIARHKLAFIAVIVCLYLWGTCPHKHSKTCWKLKCEAFLFPNVLFTMSMGFFKIYDIHAK